MTSRPQLHLELIAFLRPHCHSRDQRHLVLLDRMVAAAGLLLSETVCFDCWQFRLLLAASWQRHCQRWLTNTRIDPESLDGPLILWTIQHTQQPGQALHLALTPPILWNRCCVVMLLLICHGRAIPFLWQTHHHPSVSVRAQLYPALCWRGPSGSWADLLRSPCWRIEPFPAMNSWPGLSAGRAGAM